MLPNHGSRLRDPRTWCVARRLEVTWRRHRRSRVRVAAGRDSAFHLWRFLDFWSQCKAGRADEGKSSVKPCPASRWRSSPGISSVGRLASGGSGCWSSFAALGYHEYPDSPPEDEMVRSGARRSQTAGAASGGRARQHYGQARRPDLDGLPFWHRKPWPEHEHRARRRLRLAGRRLAVPSRPGRAVCS